MPQSGGNKGLQLKRRPRRYRMLPQQRRFKEALEYCDIRKGITKLELQQKMVECIPKFYKETEWASQSESTTQNTASHAK